MAGLVPFLYTRQNQSGSYTKAGQPNGKRLQVNENLYVYPGGVNRTLNLDATYAYDTEGKMTSVTYPTTYYLDQNGVTLDPVTGPRYTYSFDSMHRPIGLTDQNNNAAVSGVQYGGGTNSPPNAITSMSYFGVTESHSYNSLAQLTNITIPGQLNVSYAYPTGTNNGKISSQTDGISGETVSYAYDSLNRLLSAQVPSTNLAQGKTATQSSTLSGYSTDGPGSAVDGNTDGNFFDGSVTHTNYDTNAWWQVDMGSSQWVSTINIYGRTDCCSDRLSDYWVFVSDQPFLATDTPATLQNRVGTWSNHQTTFPNPSTAITVGAEGRYVRVQLSGTNYLSLAEVQVWGGWNQTFGYDAFGSLVSKTGSNSPPLSIGTNPLNNQVVGQNYDANGNQTSYNGTSLIYDAENHLLSAAGLTDYLYDSQGKRIWKGTFSGGSMTAQEVYFYGVDGQKLGTYSLGLTYSGSTVYLTDSNTNLAVLFGGKRVAVNGTAFAQDRLGSQGKYYSYGEDRNALANDQVKFATYTRDSATSLDYADQRYYSNQFGRFMTPDPYKAAAGGADPKNPQGWNRYAYVVDDPINLLDPKGLFSCPGYDYPEDEGDCNGDDGGGPPPPFAVPPDPAPPPTPECDIDLLSQKIQPTGVKTPFNHTSVELEISTGGQINTIHIDGIPVNGYLTVQIGSQAYYQDTPQTDVWSSGFSSANCLKLASIFGAAGTFPNGTYLYNVVEQNSNSLTHALLVTKTNVLPWYVNLAESLNPLTPGWLWPLNW